MIHGEGCPSSWFCPPLLYLPTASPGPLGTLAHLEILLAGGSGMGHLDRATPPGVSGMSTKLSAINGIKMVGTVICYNMEIHRYEMEGAVRFHSCILHMHL